MTGPLANPSEPQPSAKENWLDRYIRLQQRYDVKVGAALREAASSAQAAVAALDGSDGVGAAVRRTQMIGSQGAITRVLARLYRSLGDIIRAGQQEAVEESIEATFEAEMSVLDRVVSPSDLEAMQDSLRAAANRNVQSMMTRILETERPLSRRIYRAEALAKHQVDRVVNNHLARGSSAADIAKDVRAFISPNAPGGISASAKRLARTEINNAFHAQSINDYQDRPWVSSVRWHLSGSHPPNQPMCKCEQYAQIGLFTPDNVPPKPHPNCLCFVTPEVDPPEVVEAKMFTGEYESWLSQNT